MRRAGDRADDVGATGRRPASRRAAATAAGPGAGGNWAVRRVRRGQIRGGQAVAVEMAEEHARQPALVGPGEPPPGVTVTWTRLPRDAVTDLVGFLHDGSPLCDLLDELGPGGEQSGQGCPRCRCRDGTEPADGGPVDTAGARGEPGAGFGDSSHGAATELPNREPADPPGQPRHHGGAGVACDQMRGSGSTPSRNSGSDAPASSASLPLAVPRGRWEGRELDERLGQAGRRHRPLEVHPHVRGDD